MPRVGNAATDNRRTRSLQKKRDVLALVSQGKMIIRALEEVGVAKKTYESWRYHDKRFVAQMDAARAQGTVYLGGEAPTKVPGMHTTFDFAAERLYYFEHQSPWFQLEIIEAWDHMTPGDIMLVLLPPEHGKTTLYEDHTTLALGHDPSMRNHIGSESQTLSLKILGRIRNRLDPVIGWTKMEEFRMRYGPFAPPKDENKRNGQPWTATHFDVYRKGQFDERDFSLAALGFKSQIIGSRSDHLHVDDVQSVKTLNRTEQYINEFTQDWLSRPGEHGITTIMGNRIDEEDFYEALMEQIPGDILKVIRYPALIDNGNEVVPLWPDYWSLEQIERMRRKIGDVRFERNWMQRPRAMKMKTFDEATVDKCLVPLLPLGSVMQRASHVVGLDPGFGTNAVVAARFDDNGMHVTHIREDQGLYNNNQVLQACEEVIRDITEKGGIVTDFVIEDKAFQKGLMRDPQTDRIRDRYGCAIRGHQTGAEKNDENIGIPSMVNTMLRGEMHFPYGTDPFTQLWVTELRAQLLSWKPRVHGSKLRMDIVMALWFCWIQWRNRRGSLVSPKSDWKTQNRSPYPHSRGLVLPRGYTPVLTRR